MFARWNALDNCYYLKLHLLPPFFLQISAINIRTVALCGLESVPLTNDFFMQKYATNRREKYDPDDRAHRQNLHARNKIK